MTQLWELLTQVVQVVIEGVLTTDEHQGLAPDEKRHDLHVHFLTDLEESKEQERRECSCRNRQVMEERPDLELTTCISIIRNIQHLNTYGKEEEIDPGNIYLNTWIVTISRVMRNLPQ